MEDILARSGDPAAGRADLARFDKAYADRAGPCFPWNNPKARLLLHIFGNSRTLSDRLIANPSLADGIVSSPHIGKRKPKDALLKEIEEMLSVMRPGDTEGINRALRLFKYREMIRLAAQDLACTIGVREMLAEWSDVADVIVDKAYRLAFEGLCGRFGRPAQGAGTPCTGVVIALGKLGAGELNLSSDIDIIILYASDDGGAADKNGNSTTANEFYTELAIMMTRTLAQVTPDGFLFRVDHDLRPEGKQGPLANSIVAAERYYEYFGRGWERQALIRARPAAGDFALGMRFIESVRPFVYRRSISIDDLTHMRDMKEKMTREASSRPASMDIKLGRGGIRELEFLVQALQQLYGGAHPSVRNPRTFEAIDSLASLGLIHPHSASMLANSYASLRRIENMLQVEGDLQTHRLPDDESAALSLARRMGYLDDDPKSAVRRLEADRVRTTRGVWRLFSALFEADYDLMELKEAMNANLETAAGEEEEADSIAWFRQQEAKRIAGLHLGGKLPIQKVLARLTAVAQAALESALAIAMKRLTARHGVPRHDDGKRAGFAIVGMGRLGSKEVDYGSDLDLCFLYSGNGKTDGEHPVSNVEFFTRLAQRIISTVSLPTRYGRAYRVDSELRPSGRSGTLVATLESFGDYHTRAAAIWERQALLKARPIAGDDGFLKAVESLITSLAYKKTPPAARDIKREIGKLRGRFIRERARERPGLFNMKIGAGGFADLEAIIQFHQLVSAPEHSNLWHQNTFEIVEGLLSEGIIDGDVHAVIEDNVHFYRKLISLARLFSGSSTDQIEAGAAYLRPLAEAMGFGRPSELIGELEKRRKAVRQLYERTILT